MRKLTTLFFVLLLGGAAYATPAFKKGAVYQISCRQYYAIGSIVPGDLYGSNSPLIYKTEDQLSNAAYWKIEPTKDGHFTICNAQTGQYITYDGVYNATQRYVSLTDSPDGSRSEWDFEAYNGYYVIKRADNPTEVFNVRSGTYIVGTYESTWHATNEMFLLYDQSGQKLEEKDETATGTLTDYIDLQLNDKAPVYDQQYQQFMHTVPEDCFNGNDYAATLTYTATKEGANYTLYIDEEAVPSGSDHVFRQVEGGKTYTLVLKDGDKEIGRTPLTFTFLPIVEINGDFSSTYSQGSIRVNQWFTIGTDTLYNAKLKWRGATAMGKPKKSYAIKIQDDNLESKDVSFLNLREDNNWILDAAYIDPSRTRNRVSTDLWNDFSAAPYHKSQEPKLVNGTRGGFVEVLLNGVYNGIYCMTEKIDRKQLKLKKYKETDAEPVRGCLYKSSQWSYSVLMGHEPAQNSYPKTHPQSYYNSQMEWDNWEMKYPDLEDGEQIDWGPLYNAVDFVATSSNTNFRTYVERYFDMPVVRDYYLFVELLLATDNHGKNMYWYCYNRNNTLTAGLGKKAVRMSFCPWDLDGTWGRRWNGTSYYTTASKNYVEHLWNYENGELTLYKRLKEIDYKSWTDSLALRYALLRQGAFHEDSLMARFSHYREAFAASGADKRETERWVKTDVGQLDFDEEDLFLREWIHERLVYLDEQYDIENVLNTVKVENARTWFSLSGGQGRLLIETQQPLRTMLYNAAGQAVRRLDIPAGVTEINGLPKGLYVVDGQKVLIK